MLVMLKDMTTVVMKAQNFLFIVFIRSNPDIRWECYKNTAKNRSKKEIINICKNRKLSVIKVRIELNKILT